MLSCDRAFLIAVIGIALAAVGPLKAQDPRSVSQGVPGPLELAAGLRAQVAETGGPMYGVLPALLQLRRDHPASELDVLADSMVAIAVDYYRREGAQAVNVVDAARGILVTSILWEEPQGVPYSGASDRLVALAYGVEGRGGTIWALTHIPDQTAALEHLRLFAISDYPTAARAVTILAGGADGLSILRGLYDQDLVTDPYARQQLDALAAAHGWDMWTGGSGPRRRRGSTEGGAADATRSDGGLRGM